MHDHFHILTSILHLVSNLSPRSCDQVWYDDPESLSEKYRAAAMMGLRGVGPWQYGKVNTTAARGSQEYNDSSAMWQALDDFLLYSSVGARRVS